MLSIRLAMSASGARWEFHATSGCCSNIAAGRVNGIMDEIRGPPVATCGRSSPTSRRRCPNYLKNNTRRPSRLLSKLNPNMRARACDPAEDMALDVVGAC